MFPAEYTKETVVGNIKCSRIARYSIVELKEFAVDLLQCRVLILADVKVAYVTLKL